MKILWMSDSPTSPSGFGNVTRFVCAGLAEQGHRVSILGWQTRGQPQPWRDCTLYPVRHAGFGADVLHTYLRRLQPDILITLADIWWLTFISDPLNANFMRAANIPWALYYPVDGDMGDMLLPSSWVHILQTVDVPVAMSRYGQAVSHANGITPTYIPHGVDTKVFHPPADKLEAKGKLGYDGRFVILSDARNQPRKMWPRTIEIFRRFARAKDDVVLHIHCDPNDPAARALDYCYDLRSDIAFLNLGDKVRFSPDMSVTRGLALEQLASIYQAADVHLLSSWGEGFGLPNLQACSSGVVPLAADYTASQELVEGHGETIRVKHYVPDQFGLRRALIDMDDAVHKLERLYRDRALLAAKAAAARQFAEAYDWEQVVPL
jgi:glycosyltransferase involved in cell wall biosynthesis